MQRLLYAAAGVAVCMFSQVWLQSFRSGSHMQSMNMLQLALVLSRPHCWMHLRGPSEVSHTLDMLLEHALLSDAL